jgi:hypothetical protein
MSAAGAASSTSFWGRLAAGAASLTNFPPPNYSLTTLIFMSDIYLVPTLSLSRGIKLYVSPSPSRCSPKDENLSHLHDAQPRGTTIPRSFPSPVWCRTVLVCPIWGPGAVWAMGDLVHSYTEGEAAAHICGESELIVQIIHARTTLSVSV